MEGLLDAAHAISKMPKAAFYFHCIAKAYYLSNTFYNLYTMRNGLKCVCFPSAGLNEKRSRFSLKRSQRCLTMSASDLS